MKDIRIFLNKDSDMTDKATLLQFLSHTSCYLREEDRKAWETRILQAPDTDTSTLDVLYRKELLISRLNDAEIINEALGGSARLKRKTGPQFEASKIDLHRLRAVNYELAKAIVGNMHEA